MSVTPQRMPAPSAGRRVFIALLVALALLAPLGYTSLSLWQSNDDDLEFITAERSGIVLLRPMSRLITALADAQATAIDGTQPDPDQLDQAIAAVTEADGVVGSELQTRETWKDLRDKLADLKADRPVGAESFIPYSEAMDAALFVFSKVGDTSNLILDPEHATYYLMDAAVLRLPALTADGSRMTALESVRAAKDATGDDKRAGKRSDGSLQLARVLVARDRVSSAAASVQEDLSKGYGASGGRSLGTDLVRRIDAFRASAESLAPSTPVISQPLPGNLEKMVLDRADLSRAAQRLSESVLTSLDQLLAERQQGMEHRQWYVAAAGLISIALAGSLVFWCGSRWQLARPRAARDGDPQGPTSSEGRSRPEDLAPQGTTEPPHRSYRATPGASPNPGAASHRRPKRKESVRALR